jgi:hypothetical protein
MTPKELENRVLTNPGALTEAGRCLIQHGYQIWDHRQRMANGRMDWPPMDKIANISASVAL